MFKLPELDFNYDSLEPYIDKATMEIHYTKHHASYVDKLNLALKGYDIHPMISIEDLMRNLNQDKTSPIYWDIRSQGGGHLNHSMFWKMLSPNSSKTPSGKLARAIDHNFGNLENFKQRFKNSALSRFGSGWTWLIDDPKIGLFIKSTANQDTPISDGKKIVLGLDVWEHAYYLKYQNRRSEYIDNWWNVVNWDNISNEFEK